MCGLVAVSAQSKGVTVECLIDPALPGSLLGDRLRLQQVLMNLLSNATKFTGQGRIEVQVRWFWGPLPCPAQPQCACR